MTLNLHNIGEHLSSYVRKLGPLWAWSCFPFEDMNGSLLEQVHGSSKGRDETGHPSVENLDTNSSESG